MLPVVLEPARVSLKGVRKNYANRDLRDHSCWLPSGFLVRHQQRHWKMRQELCYNERGLAIVYSEDHRLTRQYIAPLPVWIDPRHQESGPLPHGVSRHGFAGLLA